MRTVPRAAARNPVAAAARLLVLAAAACPGAAPEPPRPESLEPAQAEAGTAVPITVRGRFFLGVKIDYTPGRASELRADFSARLGDNALGEVEWIDFNTLTATVPASLAEGRYDLDVVGPDGSHGTLAAAFTVTPAVPSCSAAAECADANPCTDDDCGPDHVCVRTFNTAPCDDGNACSSTDACDGAGACAHGPTDLDADGDGHFDAACPADPNVPNIDDACDDDRFEFTPAGCAAANTPPRAVARVTPAAGTTATLFSADAAGTSDAQDPPGALTYRWDWEGDGVFDTTGVTATHAYPAAGRYTVVLAADDTRGARGMAVFQVLVENLVVEVTTAADENNPGATPSSPGETGLSLREAIAYSNAAAGAQTVFVPAGMLIQLANTLPNPTAAEGVTVVGDGAVLDGSNIVGIASCVYISGDNNSFFGLEIRGCPGFAVHLNAGSGNRVSRCRIHDNGTSVSWNGTGNAFGPDNEVYGHAGSGIQIGGPAVVRGNRFHDNSGPALSIYGGADGTVVWGNTIFDNGRGIELGNQADGIALLNNTLHANAGDGISIHVGAAGAEVRNDILSANGGWGLRAVETNFAARSNNDSFGNTAGACSGCTAAEPDSRTADPGYADAAGRDLRLRPTSALIDAGLDRGLDLNGPGPGLFNGAAPDIGAWESP